ncbi:MAG: LemA family protein [Bacteroidales bacterium]|nr:LemA family protein [Bacteroidales bacterium]
MKKGLIVILAIVALFVVWGVGIYNGLVSKQETVETAVGNVQTAYQKRADLIPNLVATVKNYAEYEASTLEAVVAARAKATSTTLDANNLTEENLKAFQAAQDQISSALSRLLVTIEKYPDLKANQNFLDLQSQLEGCENGIANARREFNEKAKEYNTYLRKFPNNVIAGIFGFDRKPYFEASEAAQDAPNVGDLFNK